MALRLILLIRHGETNGESSVRFHGTGDVDLSEAGRDQMRRAAARLGDEPFDLIVASNQRRSWQSAWIVGRGAPVRIEPDFREIDFGRWEGMTREEIQASDPALYEDWQGGVAGFEYPGGERRSDFRARVARGLERLVAAEANSAIAVLHKGVIREIVRELAGEAPADGAPELGGTIALTRQPDGTWHLGRHSSNPPALEEAAA